MFVEIFQNSSLVENLALTLLHSVWQIAFVTFCLFLGLRFVLRSNANLRYAISIFALSLALILPAITFIYVSQFPFHTSNKQAISAKTSEQIQRKKIENLEELAKNGTLSSEAKPIETASNVDTWQNSLEQIFSTYSPFLVVFWLVGMLLYSLRLFGGFWQLHRFKTKEVSEVENDWKVRFIEICEQLEIKQRVKLLRSNLVKSPMVIGWIKPVILVPASVFLQMDVTQLETIIAHELMHIKRFDYLVNFAQSFVEILFFYHPCVWWISNKIRQERECACDDAVLQSLDNAQFTYANALANLEVIRSTAIQNEAQLNVAANGGKLMNRIERIVKKETKNKNRSQNSLWSASLASILILAFFATVFWAIGSSSVKQTLGWTSMNNKKIAVGLIVSPNREILKNSENSNETSNETSIHLINKLQQHNIPATVFVQGSRVYNPNFAVSATTNDHYNVTPPKVSVVKLWRDAGFEIGASSLSNLNYFEIDFDEFVTDIEKSIELVKPTLAETNQELRYFTYPSLNTGDSIESKVRFEQWLKENNLQFVPFTFSNPDSLHSGLYAMATRFDDSESIKEKVKEEFLDYVEKLIIHYEESSKELFGREIPQTLILQSSQLTIDSADELFAMFRKHGYEFVPMEKALSDDVYSNTDTFILHEGVSWFERWAFTMGKNIRRKPELKKPESFELIRDAMNLKMEKLKTTRKTSPPNSFDPPSPPLPPPPAPPKPPKPPKPPVAPQSPSKF